jgi:hypothetical protein
MLLSTFLTLVVVPVVYTLLARFTKIEATPETVSPNGGEEVVSEEEGVRISVT